MLPIARSQLSSANYYMIGRESTRWTVPHGTARDYSTAGSFCPSMIAISRRRNTPMIVEYHPALVAIVKALGPPRVPLSVHLHAAASPELQQGPPPHRVGVSTISLPHPADPKPYMYRSIGGRLLSARLGGIRGQVSLPAQWRCTATREAAPHRQIPFDALATPL